MRVLWLIASFAWAGCVGIPRSGGDAGECHAVCPCCKWDHAVPIVHPARAAHAAADLQALTALAEQDDAEAQYLLAMRLHRGEGIERNSPVSMMWLRRSAFLGHPAAQLAMGLSYAAGDQVERDDQQAARWFQLAADQGLGRAMLALGDCYRDGAGIEPDGKAAAELYRRLAGRSRCELSAGARSRLAELTRGPGSGL
jgi:uncharacterized protein